MQFETFSDFLAMGKYGFYVWLAYGVTALLLVLLVISSIHKNKTVIKQISARQKRENKLRQAALQQKELAEAEKSQKDSNEVLS
jgi:heme exporter protein D